MFHDLDATLRAMLDDPAAPADLRAADVSFDPPDKDLAPSTPTVDLFLLDLQENRMLRDPSPARERVGRVVVNHRPPRMDCSYLVTTWSARSGALKVEEEHRLLGQTLLWLGGFPVVAARFLQGSLATPPQPTPPPLEVAQSREGVNLGQFWSALGVAPRPAFTLTVTIALQMVLKPETGEKVDGVVLQPVLRPDGRWPESQP
jgi:hypothetical protein